MSSYTWNILRETASRDGLANLINNSPFLHDKPVKIEHIRTAHYAVFRVDTEKKSYVARVGVSQAERYSVSNTDYLGTAERVTHDQLYEFETGRYLFEHGAHVIQPIHYEVLPHGIDILWLPYIAGDEGPVSTQEWYDAIISLRDIPMHQNMPVFNNRKKTMTRLQALQGDYIEKLTITYDLLLADLFKHATRWGIVHGDIHADNAINRKDAILLYDLDTASWGPQVWDLTHLALREGKGRNVGYSAHTLREMLGFTSEEFRIALSLRKVASEVAKLSLPK